MRSAFTTALAALAVALLLVTPNNADPVTLKAGPITHTLKGYKVLRVIPASWTVERFKNVAKPKPAGEGEVWYVIAGKVTNGDSEKRLVTAGTFKVIDSAGNEYKADVKNVLYQPEGTSVSFISVEPGATKTWMAFFPIPESATGLVLRANDLTFGGKQVVKFKLPDPAAALADAPVPTAAPKKARPPSATRTQKKVAAPAPAPAKAAGGSTLRLEALGLTMQAPADAKVRKLGNTFMVQGSGLIANVGLSSSMRPTSLGDAKKEAAETYSASDLKSETLPDGWALTFQNVGSVGTNYWVNVRRTIGGQAYWCETTASMPEQQLAALEACKSLRP